MTVSNNDSGFWGARTRHPKGTARVTSNMTRVRSSLEATLLEWLLEHEVTFIYEGAGLSYVTKHIYTPDFVITTKNNRRIYIEAKGWFQPKDRTKMLAIKKQYPKADIRFVFQNSNKLLYKGSKTTYAQWATKWKFPWSNKSIPKKWIEE